MNTCTHETYSQSGHSVTRLDPLPHLQTHALIHAWLTYFRCSQLHHTQKLGVVFVPASWDTAAPSWPNLGSGARFMTPTRGSLADPWDSCQPSRWDLSNILGFPSLPRLLTLGLNLKMFQPAVQKEGGGKWEKDKSAHLFSPSPVPGSLSRAWHSRMQALFILHTLRISCERL